MASPLNADQFVPANVLRDTHRPEPHELYSENTGEPWFHHDDHENLRQARAAKLSEAQRLRYEDEPEGPDNKSLVDHIRSNGFPQTVLVDPRWKRITDGNHSLEAAHHIDPNYPVPVKYTH